MILIFVSGSVVFPLQASNPRDPWMRALSQVESGGNKDAIGKQGERSEYQLSYVVYKHHIGREGSYAEFIRYCHSDANVMYLVRTHAKWLAGMFINRTKRIPNNFEFYAMWNIGFHGFERRGFNIEKCPRITRNAALKYEALINQYNGKN